LQYLEANIPEFLPLNKEVLYKNILKMAKIHRAGTPKTWTGSLIWLKTINANAAGMARTACQQ